MNFIKQSLTFDIGRHHDLSTLEILYLPRQLASVYVKSLGLINHDVDRYQNSKIV